MKVEGYSVEKKKEVVVWENPLLLQPRFDHTMKEEELSESITVYVPLTITSDSIINSFNKVTYKYADRGFISYRNASYWSEEYYQVLRKLDLYDAVWREKEIAEGKLQKSDKHSHHGIKTAHRIFQLLSELESDDDISPYQEAEDLCKEYGFDE